MLRRMRGALLVVGLAGCGRIHFAAVSDAADTTDADPCASPQLAACYSFEGHVDDATANANHATATNAVHVPGHDGGLALKVDTTSTVVVVDSPSLDIGGPITIDVWIRPIVLPAVARAVIMDRDFGIAFLVQDGVVRADVLLEGGGSSFAVVGPAPLVVGGWNHVAVMFDTTTFTLWHDGAQVGSMAMPGLIDVANPNGTRIGGALPSGDEFSGAIDNLRIWNAAVTCAVDGSC